MQRRNFISKIIGTSIALFATMSAKASFLNDLKTNKKRPLFIRNAEYYFILVDTSSLDLENNCSIDRPIGLCESFLTETGKVYTEIYSIPYEFGKTIDASQKSLVAAMKFIQNRSEGSSIRNSQPELHGIPELKKSSRFLYQA